MKKKNKKSFWSGGPKLWGQFGSQIILTLLVLVLIVAVYSTMAERERLMPEISVSELARDVSAGQVAKISVKNDDLEIFYIDGQTKKSRKEPDASIYDVLSQYEIEHSTLANLEVEVKNPAGVGFWLLNILPFLIPVFFIFFLFWLITRQMKGASMQAFSFGQSRARIIDPNDASQKVTFKDVAGVKEAKDELLEIVDFLRNPKKFIDIGARIPKGVLMIGAPGTGKTLLARAVAGEAHVPFFYLSASEFVEMFVGVGASRVRDLFKMAKKAAPSIIFIDEIDAIGRHRGSGMGGGNDEREQTLNQILVEMDGFEPHEKLIVMSATNRPDVLDPALLRPGRFDRRVVLDQPDIKDREEILAIHVRKKPLAEDVDLRVVAERTPGFSGADLANVMNEGAILAARENRKKVSQYDLLRSVEKVMLGPERKSHILSIKEKRITAYHEMGHALIASVLEFSDPVHKVSIISRGHAAGYTLKLPFEDKKLSSRREFLDDIAVSLGGYMAEKIVFGDVTTGAANDIQVSTSLAHDMVSRYGMSDKIGPVAFDSNSPKISAGMMADRIASNSTQALIDEEVSKIMKSALTQAEKILIDKRSALDAMAEELIKVETLEREDFEKLLVLNGIKPKTRVKEEIKDKLA